MVDLKQELDRLLMLISGRCLLGKEVREMIFCEVLTLFDELFDSSTRINMARTKLSELFTKIVRSRKSSKRVEEDVLQNLLK
jgi:sterol 14-demethylase